MSQQVGDQETFEFEVEGKVEKLSRDEVARRLKWDSTNTQRATEIKREREAVEAERQRIAEREARLDAERSRLNTTLETLINKTTAESEPEVRKPKVSAHDTIKPYLDELSSLDFVSDSSASQKLQRNIAGLTEGLNQAIESQNEEMRQEYEKRIAATEQRLSRLMEGKVAEATQQAEVKLTRHTAAEEAQEKNDRTFKTVLNTELSGLRLSDAEVESIRKKAETTYGEGSGQWDAAAGRWVINERSVLEAARSIDSVFDKMRAADRSSARADGLQARLRGEDASRSTPNRSRPAFGGEPDDSGLADKFALLEARLQARTISPAEAMAALSPQEVAAFKEARARREALLRGAG